MGAGQANRSPCCSRVSTACFSTADTLPCVTTCDTDDPCLSNVEGATQGGCQGLQTCGLVSTAAIAQRYQDNEKIMRQLAFGPQVNQRSVFFEEEVSDGISKIKSSPSTEATVQNSREGTHVNMRRPERLVPIYETVESLEWTDAAVALLNRESPDWKAIAAAVPKIKSIKEERDKVSVQQNLQEEDSSEEEKEETEEGKQEAEAELNVRMQRVLKESKQVEEEEKKIRQRELQEKYNMGSRKKGIWSSWHHDPKICSDGKTEYQRWCLQMERLYADEEEKKKQMEEERKKRKKANKARLSLVDAPAAWDIFTPERKTIADPLPSVHYYDKLHRKDYGAHHDAEDMWQRHQPVPPQKGDGAPKSWLHLQAHRNEEFEEYRDQTAF